jgi:hypothetical protein
MLSWLLQEDFVGSPAKCAGSAHGPEGQSCRTIQKSASFHRFTSILGGDRIMTIRTLHKVNVVGTLPLKVGCIHLFHIPVAAGYRRVAGITGIPGIVGMVTVAGPAADPLMHAHRGAVIFTSGFVRPVG